MGVLLLSCYYAAGSISRHGAFFSLVKRADIDIMHSYAIFNQIEAIHSRVWKTHNGSLLYCVYIAQKLLFHRTRNETFERETLFNDDNE